MCLHGNEKVRPSQRAQTRLQTLWWYCLLPLRPEPHDAGKKMRFIVDTEANPDSVQSDHFKELGRWISVDLSEDKMKAEIGRRVSQDLEKLELSGVNGLSKLFLYEHFLVSRLSWVFLVHDLSASFAQSLDKKVIPRLKSWAGLFRSSDLGALFRRREHLGLQLTSITLCYKHMQLVKCCLLENSNDPNIRDIYKIRKNRVTAFSARWSALRRWKHLFPWQSTICSLQARSVQQALGLTAASYIGTPTLKDLREKATKALVDEVEEKHMQHAACLPLQGVWTKWTASIRPLLAEPYCKSAFTHQVCVECADKFRAYTRHDAPVGVH